MSAKGFFGNWIVKNLLGAIALFAALIIAAMVLLQVITKHNQEIVVPDLTNMSVEEAAAILSAKGMRIDVVDSTYVKRMGKGLIYRQNPKAGSHVKKGRRILITINAVNAKQVTMPNLVGYSTRQAKAELLSRGLELGRLIYIDDIATNNVLRQLHGNHEIKAGTMVDSESVIDLVVGLNSNDNRTFMPDVLGMKYKGAVETVHDNSLNINRLIFDKTVSDYSDSLNAVVYRQDPDISELPLLIGSDVNLYLTTDRNKVPVRTTPEKEQAE